MDSIYFNSKTITSCFIIKRKISVIESFIYNFITVMGVVDGSLWAPFSLLYQKALRYILALNFTAKNFFNARNYY